jgi:uncharacterized protein (TIGR03086 family)
MSADILERAFQSSAKALANLQAGQLDDPTPCSSWKVRDLVNHIVGGAEWFAISTETGVGPAGGGDDAARDWCSGDIQANFDENTRRALAAFRAPGAMEKNIKLPFGEMPGSAFVMLAACDTFTHAWDLSKALGQSTDLDPEMAEQLLGFAKQAIPEQFRGPEPAPFGPIVEVPETAPKADQLAGFLGRNV